MGLLQANEVIKLVAGIGEPLVGRLLLYESLGTRFTELKVSATPSARSAATTPPEIAEEIGKFPDYELFCGARGPRADADDRLAPSTLRRCPR